MKRWLSLALSAALIVLSCGGCTDIKPAETTPESATEAVFGYAYQGIENEFVGILGELGYANYTIYDSSELSFEMLENRSGKTIVERCIGVVIDQDTGDGIMLNAKDSQNYIKYRPGNPSGTVFASYMVYNPETDYYDDIIERYDFPLMGETINIE